MDRRETIKSVLLGSLATGLILQGCAPEEKTKQENPEMPSGPYGRTEKEKARDARVMSETFFSPQEMAAIGVLCNLILPASGSAVSAVDADVPGFIEFIVKDIPSHQLPLRGGLMWLEHRSNTLFNQSFIHCSPEQHKQLLDEIAYPNDAAPEAEAGVKFFNRMRNLVLTGYYTTKAGIDDLGYKGNTPTVWDGVPEDVLAKHGLAYDKDWLAKCVNQDKRDILAQWDEEGNLIDG
jgi:hypothetical protein